VGVRRAATLLVAVPHKVHGKPETYKGCAMRTDTLRDAHFKTIGYIETDARGKQTAKTAQFVTLGYYDPGTNWTVDRHFCRVSSGNSLASLISNS
jgi:hypothetical protein